MAGDEQHPTHYWRRRSKIAPWHIDFFDPGGVGAEPARGPSGDV